jgi:hypothetical protein
MGSLVCISAGMFMQCQPLVSHTMHAVENDFSAGVNTLVPVGHCGWHELPAFAGTLAFGPQRPERTAEQLPTDCHQP